MDHSDTSRETSGQTPASIVVDAGPSFGDLVGQADVAEAEGRLIDAIELLQQANRLREDGEIEVRLVGLRDRGFSGIQHTRSRTSWPPTYPDLTPAADPLPEIDVAELSEATLGSAIINHGALLVRGLLDAPEVAQVVADIDATFEAYDTWATDPSADHDVAPWFSRFRPANGYPDSKLARTFVREAGGVWLADSPRLMFRLVELFDQKGLRRVLTDYFGDRPALSLKKSTLKRVPVDTGVGWHQDGAFMGDAIRTVNVFIALTDCGGPDSEVPALDVVPRRFDHIVEMGTEGAPFPWFVGPGMAEHLAGEQGIVRPTFKAGDALLFDDLFLHTTAASPEMSGPRYAVESWFFASSDFPADQFPLIY